VRGGRRAARREFTAVALPSRRIRRRPKRRGATPRTAPPSRAMPRRAHHAGKFDAERPRVASVAHDEHRGEVRGKHARAAVPAIDAAVSVPMRRLSAVGGAPNRKMPPYWASNPDTIPSVRVRVPTRAERALQTGPPCPRRRRVRGPGTAPQRRQVASSRRGRSQWPGRSVARHARGRPRFAVELARTLRRPVGSEARRWRTRERATRRRRGTTGDASVGTVSVCRALCPPQVSGCTSTRMRGAATPVHARGAGLHATAFFRHRGCDDPCADFSFRDTPR